MKMFWRLLMLELRIYFRTPVAVVWTFLFPTVLLSVMLISFEQKIRQSLPDASPIALPFTELIAGHGPISYPAFLLPGCVVLMLYASCLFRFAVPLAGLRQSGFMRTSALFPVPAITHVGVAIVSHIVIIVFFCGALYAYAALVFGVPLPPSATALGLSVALLLLGSMALLSLGLVIGTRTQSTSQAVLICYLIYYPSVLMSNLLVPDRVLPDWMAAIAGVFPLRSLVDALRLAVVGHLGMTDLARTVAFLAGWAIACLLLIRPRRLWYATQRDLVRFVIKRARRRLIRLSIRRAPRPASG
jgi:ABC-2 type transport system permease protein